MADDKKPNKKELSPDTATDNPKLAQLVEVIKGLTLVEAADLVKTLSQTFGVAATMPVGVAGGPASASPVAEGEKEEEQTTFNVILASGGANKIAVIKAVRELVPILGLKEAKDLVEAAPKEVLTGVNKAAAQEAQTKLTQAGATVELK